MKALVTGAAGFIGSHLSEELVERGHEVIGIDCFTDYYSRRLKEDNLSLLLGKRSFTFTEDNLLTVDLSRLLEGVSCVFHLAAQAGVRASWGTSFAAYVENNIEATQRLLETAKDTAVQKVVFASSSSVYGDSPSLPMAEDQPTLPISPYGVTKLAGERLCYLYWKSFSLPTVCLRYFTVYGPRQRPDMAFHIFIRAILKEDLFTVYGDGSQTRDFTFITDAVRATISAAEMGKAGQIYNIGGGSRVSLRETVKVLELLTNKTARVNYTDWYKGDPRHTYADTCRARTDIEFRPERKLVDGLAAQVEWLRGVLNM